MQHKIMVIFLALVGIYIAIAAFLFVFQSHLIFFPEREIHSTPHEIGLPYEAISFKSEDGVQLLGWFVPAEKPLGILLFCHGNAGNIADRLHLIEIFHRLNLSVFIFDYRGYGQSEGKPSEKGTYLDAKAAWDYLTLERGIPKENIIVFGRSLGGAIAAQLSLDHEPAGLIVESGFTSVPDLAAEHYPFLPTRFLTRFSYATGDYLTRVKCPVLIIHGREDEIVPFSQGRRLFERANDPKEFLEIRGDHNTGAILSGETYTSGVLQFITRVVDGKLAP